MSKIKIPTAYKTVDTDKLSEADLKALLEVYSQIGDVQTYLIEKSNLPVKEEIIKVLSVKVNC